MMFLTYLLRQMVFALTVVTGLLLIGEILAPGLVLPFLNLHLLIIATLLLNMLPLAEGAQSRVWWRLGPVLPIVCILIASIFLFLVGPSPSAMMMAIVYTVFVLAVTYAITVV